MMQTGADSCGPVRTPSPCGLRTLPFGESGPDGSRSDQWIQATNRSAGSRVKRDYPPHALGPSQGGRSRVRRTAGSR
jgi:hypothetical protein